MKTRMLARRGRPTWKSTAQVAIACAHTYGIKLGTVACFLLSAAGCSGNVDDFASADTRDADAGILGESEDKALSGTTYQAEARTRQSGASFSNSRDNFEGTGYMDFDGNRAWIEWNTVSATAQGDYALTFRYANGGAGNRQAAITVNGVSVGSLPFASTGSWTTWTVTPSVKATLRSGRNTIRVTANTDTGGPNLDSMTVRGTDGSGGGATVKDLNFVNFRKLSKDTNTPFSNVTSKYLILDASHGSQGHDDVDKNDPRFVEISGAKLIGYGGGWDKYLVLCEVTSRDVRIRTHAGSRVVFVNTSRTLSFIQAKSLDPSMPQGKEDVPSPNGSNEIVVYAEDEGAKGTPPRYETFGPKAHKAFGIPDDDIIYIFAQTLGDTPTGNGAYMRLKIR